MNKIEFKTKVENGVIEIPKIYKDFMSGELRIIAVKETLDNKEIGKEKEINAFIELQRFNYEHTKDLVFDKDIDIDELMSDINEVKL